MGPGFLKFLDFFADKLETGQGVHGLHTEGFRNFSAHPAGYNGLDDAAVLRKRPHRLPRAQIIMNQKGSGLISGQGHIFPPPVFHHNANPVTVRIRSNDQIRSLFLCHGNGQGEHFVVLRIWILHSGKVGIRLLLLRNNGDVLKAQFLQHTSDRFVACTVNRCIDHLQVFAFLLHQLPVNAQILYLPDVF